MSLGNIYTAVVFDEAQELVGKLLDPTVDGDDLADLLEHIVDKSDRAMSVLMYLTLSARGVEFQPAVRDANATGGTGKLILPGQRGR